MSESTIYRIRGTKMLYRANTYCGNIVNGHPCRNRVELPIPYTRDDIWDAMCSDCRRANVEAIASTELDERLMEGAK
jgi:hypothetical protein